MPYKYTTSKNFDRILEKIEIKNKELHHQILKKMNEILNCYDAEHYKNLMHDLKEFKRAHIGHFVLVFRFDKTNKLIYFTDLDHHDTIYKKK